MLLLRIVISLACGYIFGCFSTAYFVGKCNHIDIRDYGSGNAGTTNAMRTLGFKAGMITFLGDLLKAIIPIVIFRELIFADLPEARLLSLYVGFGVVLGHNYPFWLKFHGGKGIAVTSGVIAAFHPILIPIFFILFAGAVLITKYVSVGSLLISVCLPIAIAIMYPGDWHMICIGAVYTVSAFITHHSNIKRLLHGTENKFSIKKKEEPTV